MLWCLCSGELLLIDDEVVPVAMKPLPYNTKPEQFAANAEMAALKDAQGGAHIVQCYGAFDYTSPVDGRRHLYVALE